jgi:rhodanese-related sulfurtransferase
MPGWLIWVAIIGVSAVFLFSSNVPKETSLTPAQVKERMDKEQDLQLIDVRTPGEFAAGRLQGAKNIPLHDLQARLGEISKDKPLIVYCRSGHRSASALKLLRRNGFAQTKHMDGGINAWQGRNLPVEK